MKERERGTETKISNIISSNRYSEDFAAYQKDRSTVNGMALLTGGRSEGELVPASIVNDNGRNPLKINALKLVVLLPSYNTMS